MVFGIIDPLTCWAAPSSILCGAHSGPQLCSSSSLQQAEAKNGGRRTRLPTGRSQIVAAMAQLAGSTIGARSQRARQPMQVVRSLRVPWPLEGPMAFLGWSFIGVSAFYWTEWVFLRFLHSMEQQLRKTT